MKHPAILYPQEIAAICRPLQKFKISYFAHVNINQASEFSAISNQPDFTEHYLEKKYYNADIHMAKLALTKEYFIWDFIKCKGLSAKLNQDAIAHGFKHPFTIMQKNKDGFNYYHFATTLADQAINQTYLSNIDLLKLFILHFKEKIAQSKYLVRAYDLKFGIDQSAKGFTIRAHEKEMNDDVIRQSFLQEISINNSCLSKRELECLQLTLQGQTAKQIANTFGISYRTIEEYLKNLKTKMGVPSKMKLIEKIRHQL